MGRPPRCHSDQDSGKAVLGRNILMSFGLKRGIALPKREPSAQRPWQNTMLGLVPLPD
jgi:hypothetical protein